MEDLYDFGFFLAEKLKWAFSIQYWLILKFIQEKSFLNGWKMFWIVKILCEMTLSEWNISEKLMVSEKKLGNFGSCMGRFFSFKVFIVIYFKFATPTYSNRSKT